MGELQGINNLIQKNTIIQIILIKPDNSEVILRNVLFKPGDLEKNLTFSFSTLGYNKIKLKRISGELFDDYISNSFLVTNLSQSQQNIA